MNQEIKLVPITEETNIKGKTAFVKVELAGGLSVYKNILARYSYLYINNNSEITLESFNPNSVFIPTEPKPKYDPNRRFRKGDLVTLVDHYRGDAYRKFIGHEFEVKQDEAADGQVTVATALNTKLEMTSIYFQLVKPVEEIEEEEREKNPYYTEILDDGVTICQHNGSQYVVFFKNSTLTKGKAIELAQFACDKLNEQHRKENNL